MSDFFSNHCTCKNDSRNILYIYIYIEQACIQRKVITRRSKEENLKLWKQIEW